MRVEVSVAEVTVLVTVSTTYVALTSADVPLASLAWKAPVHDDPAVVVRSKDGTSSTPNSLRPLACTSPFVIVPSGPYDSTPVTACLTPPGNVASPLMFH